MKGQKNMEKSGSKRPSVKSIIRELKSGKRTIFDVPEDLASNPEIIEAERKFGLRRSGHRGFDIITQKFFVEEEFLRNDITNWNGSKRNKMLFDSFEEYYNYLDGDIYEDACYYQYLFDDSFSSTLNLDMGRLREKKCFVLENVDDYSHGVSKKEIEEYNYIEKNKRNVRSWIKKFNSCERYEEFHKICNNYEKTVMSKNIKIDFFIFQYAFQEGNSKRRLETIMEFLFKDYYISNIVRGLCLIYDPDEVIEQYNFVRDSKSANARRKREIQEFVSELRSEHIEKRTKCFFDKTTHFYCEEVEIYYYTNKNGRRILNKWNDENVCKAFETFDEFIKYRNGDLRNCDLSGNYNLSEDFSKYTLDETTILPIGKNGNLEYKIKKLYENEKFVVNQTWNDNTGKIVKQYHHIFEYFFDFIAFLKGDLSNANLIFCHGLNNVHDTTGVNLTNVQLTSSLKERFGIPYTAYVLDEKLIGKFPLIESNEKHTEMGLSILREIDSVYKDITIAGEKRIQYISDLHLVHRIVNAKCKSKEDVVYILQRIVDNIIRESKEVVLVGGDVSSVFSVFELFVKLLRDSLNKRQSKTEFIFILGNHEFWDFSGFSLEQISKRYRKLLEENDMNFLYNDLLYINRYNEMKVITCDELMKFDKHILSEKLKYARLTVLGGIGFSGYNKEFNADNGVYRNTIDRKIEIQESKKFENIYNKLIEVLDKKNTIIFTHTPKKDWCADENYHEGFIYVSGHNHRNEFFDDGIERRYADNQIGYGNENIHLKSFFIDSRYDCFADYKDGIYEITAQEYRDFAQGKNIYMNFNRNVNTIYMLKKIGYYCFIHKTKNGMLSILNGGELRRLDVADIQYYYDNMDMMIRKIKNPLDEYTDYQKRIANEIKKIGGDGRIHGCIIDINFYNHVYVNPIDMTVTGYWAENIINKKAYPTISALLKRECPTLYSNYLKMIGERKADLLMIKQAQTEIEEKTQAYLETDIYRASREIRKMQKLNYNVLTAWYENTPERLELEEEM